MAVEENWRPKKGPKNRNNNIGADYTSQTLIDFDWYNLHLYHVPEELKKNFNIPVFLHRIIVRKRVQGIPHLRKRKIVKQR